MRTGSAWCRWSLVAALAGGVLQPAGATDLIEAWQATQQHAHAYAAAVSGRQIGATQREQAAALWRPTVQWVAATGVASHTLSMDGARFAAPGFPSTTGVSFGSSIQNGDFGRWGLQVQQPVWSLQRRAESRQLDLAADLTEQAWQQQRQSLMLELAQRYFAVVLALETQRVQQQQHRAVQRAWEEAQARYTAGEAPITAVHEAAARAESVRAQLMVADTALVVKQASLQDFTGWSATHAPVRIPTADPSMADELPLDHWMALAHQHNPTLRMKHIQRQMAEQEVAKFGAMAAPQLDLLVQAAHDQMKGVGADGRAATLQEGWQLGLQLSIPLYTGGYRSARQEEASHRAEQARAEHEDERQRVEQSARSAWMGWTTGMGRIAALSASLRSHRSRLDATRIGVEVGDRTLLDLLNAESDQATTELSLLQARVDRFMSRLQLLAVSGQLDEAELTRVSAWLK